ncbi:hypothetical protein [Paenibacillus turpanensis]|uniref:hypothetical protein n=1 Tax=Paenibacillus turpanensis TaxID=2689078 RepID=UPI00140BD6A9|nr:hypothetical protein [Paenibacillus turpanensis]
MQADTFLSVVHFFFWIGVLMVVLMPIGTFLDVFANYIASGRLAKAFEFVFNIIHFLIFTLGISWIDQLLHSVELNTVVEFLLALVIYIGLNLIQQLGDYVKRKDQSERDES